MIEIPPSGTRGVNLRGWPIIRALMGLFTALYRRSGGRISALPFPVLALTTIGARSGRERSVLLGRFPDDEGRWLIVASLAGAARHPAWLINIARHPDQVWVQISGQRFKVRPQVLRGEERAAAWTRIVASAAQFARYQDLTDREIPVVRLTREPS